MARLYEYSSLVDVQDRTILDILTSKKRTSIHWWKFDKDWDEMRSKSFAINYGEVIGDRSPFMRGFEYNDRQFEISLENKEIIEVKRLGYPFYDSDKMEEKFMFEGSLQWFLKHFIKSGYKVPNLR